MTTPGRSLSERGNAALQTAVLTPVMLLLVGVIIQGGLWFHAKDVALAAAEEGARASAAQGGSSGDGKAAAESFAGRVGAGVLRGVGVSATRSAESTTVVVAGHSVSLVPFVAFEISQSATLPVERTT